MIPDDAAGRPLSPSELATIADLERRLLLDAPAPARRRHRQWYRFANAVHLATLLGAGVVLVIVAGVTGGLLAAGAVLTSVVATAFAWPLLPPALGGPLRPRRPRRFPRAR